MTLGESNSQLESFRERYDAKLREKDAEIAQLRGEYRALETAFLALWQFADVELAWMWFRAEFGCDKKAATESEENAQKLREFLRSLRDAVPAVAKCLERKDGE